MLSRIGAIVGGRWTYEAAGHWGDENPWEAAGAKDVHVMGVRQSQYATFIDYRVLQ
jgi:hypothetical protein